MLAGDHQAGKSLDMVDIEGRMVRAGWCWPRTAWLRSSGGVAGDRCARFPASGGSRKGRALAGDSRMLPILSPSKHVREPPSTRL